MNKMNTFTDFVDCTEYWPPTNTERATRLPSRGGSAGGLAHGPRSPICAPDLFKVVVSPCAFLWTWMNTMLDASLPLTVAEYEEWGNPNEKPAYDYMLRSIRRTTI